MFRAYKYRIFPSAEQAQQMERIFGCVRFVWNLALETRNTVYRSAGKILHLFDLNSQVKELRDTEAEWLKEAPAQAFQAALLNQDQAYTNFFKGGGFPKFKSKRGYQSFQLPQHVKVDFEGGRIFIPKVRWVDCIFSRTFEGKIKTVTVSKTPTGKYFVAVLVDTGTEPPERKPIQKATAVGIDLGIKDFVVLSDGQTFANPRFLSQSLKRLRIENRSLARKKKDSANREKQRLVVARLHEKIANQRADYLHKVSTAIIKQYDTICIEDLAVKNMMQNRSLSRSIADVAWGTFGNMLNRKADQYGKNILRIGRFEPSSRACNVCGWHNKDLKLSERVWVCENGHRVERDLNAALNILDFGLRSQPLCGNVDH